MTRDGYLSTFGEPPHHRPKRFHVKRFRRLLLTVAIRKKFLGTNAALRLAIMQELLIWEAQAVCIGVSLVLLLAMADRVLQRFS
jgi:hypothetical protein